MAWIRAVCTWNMDQKTVKPGYWHLAHLPGYYLTPSAELFMKQSRRDEAGLNPANLPIGPPHPATRQLKPAQAGEEFSQHPASITVTVTGTAESARLNSWELSRPMRFRQQGLIVVWFLCLWLVSCQLSWALFCLMSFLTVTYWSQVK